MSTNLDKSLDDIISSNKKPRGPPRGRGPARGAPARGPRATPYSRPPRPQPIPRRGNLNEAWQHDMFPGAGAAQGKPTQKTPQIPAGGALVKIEGLHYGVSQADLKELLTLVGPIKFCRIHYDASGRSEGTGEGLFLDAADARKAKAKYDGVTFDGEVMKFTVVEAGAPAATGHVPPRLASGLTVGAPRATIFDRLGDRAVIDVDAADARRSGGGAQRAPRRAALAPAPRAPPRAPRAQAAPAGRGRGGARAGRAPPKPVTADGLDADLDAYMAGNDAMEADAPAAAAAAGPRKIVAYDDVQVVG